MTFRMNAEYDSRWWLQATKIRPPTDKEKLHLSEVQVGPSGHTPLFFTKGEPRRGGCWTCS